MAEDELNSVLVDLQRHLKTARVDVNNLSTIAQKGNDKVGINRSLYEYMWKKE